MDDAGPGVAIGSRDRQVAESHPAKPGNDSRNASFRDASSIGTAASVQVIEGFTNQPVEPPRGLVFGDLSIPRAASNSAYQARQAAISPGDNCWIAASISSTVLMDGSIPYEATAANGWYLGGTVAINGLQPWTSHTAGIYCESAASLGSPFSSDSPGAGMPRSRQIFFTRLSGISR